MIECADGEILGNTGIVVRCLQESGAKMTLEEISNATGLERYVVAGTLTNIRIYGSAFGLRLGTDGSSGEYWLLPVNIN